MGPTVRPAQGHGHQEACVQGTEAWGWCRVSVLGWAGVPRGSGTWLERGMLGDTGTQSDRPRPRCSGLIPVGQTLGVPDAISCFWDDVEGVDPGAEAGGQAGGKRPWDAGCLGQEPRCRPGASAWRPVCREAGVGRGRRATHPSNVALWLPGASRGVAPPRRFPGQRPLSGDLPRQDRPHTP